MQEKIRVSLGNLLVTYFYGFLFLSNMKKGMDLG